MKLKAAKYDVRNTRTDPKSAVRPSSLWKIKSGGGGGCLVMLDHYWYYGRGGRRPWGREREEETTKWREMSR